MIKWVLATSGYYHTGATWRWIRSPHPKVWSKLIWFKGSVPKHSMICRLPALNRLSTRDRQLKRNPLASPQCSFCDSNETRVHLFFNCLFASQLQRAVILKIGKTGAIPNDWNQLVIWASHALKRKKAENTLAKIDFQACLYHVWREINLIIINECY